MSFLDDIVDVGSSVLKGLSGPGILPTVARTAALGFALSTISKSINKDNTKPDAANTTAVDRTARVQQSPDAQHKIPVVYGTSYVGGIVTEAVQTNGGGTMYFVLTICEKTGTKISDNQASTFKFDEIYWDGSKINFQADGITLESVTDASGNTNNEWQGLIKVYCYGGNSSTPVAPTGYTNSNIPVATSVVPNWTLNHSMSDLVFAVVRVDYNATKNLTTLGTIDFKITNSMTLPGDCIYDYMTNERYGAGIPQSEIYTQ